MADTNAATEGLLLGVGVGVGAGVGVGPGVGCGVTFCWMVPFAKLRTLIGMLGCVGLSGATVPATPRRVTVKPTSVGSVWPLTLTDRMLRLWPCAKVTVPFSGVLNSPAAAGLLLLML